MVTKKRKKSRMKKYPKIDVLNRIYGMNKQNAPKNNQNNTRNERNIQAKVAVKNNEKKNT